MQQAQTRMRDLVTRSYLHGLHAPPQLKLMIDLKRDERVRREVIATSVESGTRTSVRRRKYVAPQPPDHEWRVQQNLSIDRSRKRKLDRRTDR